MSSVFSFFFGRLNSFTFGAALAALVYGLANVESPANFGLHATYVVVGTLLLVWEGALYLDGR